MADNKNSSNSIQSNEKYNEMAKEQKNIMQSVFTINRSMLVTKSSYFFTHTVFGCILPYVTVFLTSVGLSASQAGYINGLRAAVSALCSPIWGAVADHTDRRLVVYLCLSVGTLAVIFPLPWIAKHINGDMLHTFSSNNVTLNQSLQFNSTQSNNTTTYSSSEINTHLFPVMLAILLLAAAFDFPLIAFQDSLVMRVVTASKSLATFGPQRVYASIGFGFANLIAGLAADNYKSSGMSSYTAIVFVLLPAGLIMIPLGCIMHNKARWNEVKKDKRENEKKSNILYLTFKTCIKLPNIIFFSTVFIMGVANTLVYGFTSLFIERELKGSKSIIGISFTVLTISEIPIFLFSTPLIRLLRGRWVCITISVFSYFLRFLLVSFIENPWLIVPIQAMNSIGFALFWACALEETYAISPVEITTTMISILNSIHFSLSFFISSMICGVLYDKYGGRMLFRGSAFLFLIWAVLIIIYHCGLERYIIKKTGKDNITEDGIKDITLNAIDNPTFVP